MWPSWHKRTRANLCHAAVGIRKENQGYGGQGRWSGQIGPVLFKPQRDRVPHCVQNTRKSQKCPSLGHPGSSSIQRWAVV